MIDNQLNHYEGFVQTDSSGNILCHGAGVFYKGDKEIKGIFKDGEIVKAGSDDADDA